MHIYTHIQTYIYIHTYTYTYVHTYIRTYIHTYIHIYIHTYTVLIQTPRWNLGNVVSPMSSPSSNSHWSPWNGRHTKRPAKNYKANATVLSGTEGTYDLGGGSGQLALRAGGVKKYMCQKERCLKRVSWLKRATYNASLVLGCNLESTVRTRK